MLQAATKRHLAVIVYDGGPSENARGSVFSSRVCCAVLGRDFTYDTVAGIKQDAPSSPSVTGATLRVWRGVSHAGRGG